MTNERLEHLRRFYELLDALEQKIGRARTLSECHSRLPWPQRGVYFFRENAELRTDSGTGPRIVRVGTHALKVASATTLWTRLSQHRGRKRSGSGNHRGSIFRSIVGAALIARDGYDVPTWGDGNNAPAEIRAREKVLEAAVSQVVGAMPFIWLGIEDEPGEDSFRGYIERNAIALLSNCDRPSLDRPSPKWLGHHCNRDLVRRSGLWNQRHVEETYEPAFLDALGRLVKDA